MRGETETHLLSIDDAIARLRHCKHWWGFDAALIYDPVTGGKSPQLSERGKAAFKRYEKALFADEYPAESEAQELPSKQHTTELMPPDFQYFDRSLRDVVCYLCTFGELGNTAASAPMNKFAVAIFDGSADSAVSIKKKEDETYTCALDETKYLLDAIVRELSCGEIGYECYESIQDNVPTIYHVNIRD